MGSKEHSMGVMQGCVEEIPLKITNEMTARPGRQGENGSLRKANKKAKN